MIGTYLTLMTAASLMLDFRICGIPTCDIHTLWRDNRFTVDACNEHFSVLSTTDVVGDNFKVLGIEFHFKLLMFDGI